MNNMNLQIGSTIGDYQVVGILGAGGMGKVYKVRNVISDRIEAMKVLLPDLANAPDLADRFLREIKVQASMEHPNIAALHTAVRVDNQLLMLMEFVEGVTLEHRLKEGPLPIGDAVDYVRQVLSALDYAHQRGVIHRDIKPANMIVTPGGVVKLMDFGIAKAATDHRLTQTGTTLGSLYYMSPEQIQGAASLDARSDLYSVGVTLYELTTGKRPFDGDSQFAIMSAHLEKTPVPPITLDPRLPQLFNDVVLMSVSKDPGQRFQTAGAFRNALGNVVPSAAPAPVQAAAAAAPGTVPIPAPQPLSAARSAQPNAAPKGKRGLWMALGAVAAVAAVVAVIQFAPWKGSTASPAADVPVVQSTPPPEAQQALPPAMEQPVVAPPAVAVQQTTPSLPTRPQKQTATAAPARSAQVSQQVPAIQAQQQAAAPVTQAPPIQQAAPPAAPQQRTAEPAVNRAALQDAREDLMKLNARAGGVRASLQSLQRSQAAGGLNLRGDMQEASTMMESYLKGATEALNAGDLPAAKSFMDRGERQLERLEKFLNR